MRRSRIWRNFSLILIRYRIEPQNVRKITKRRSPELRHAGHRIKISLNRTIKMNRIHIGIIHWSQSITEKNASRGQKKSLRGVGNFSSFSRHCTHRNCKGFKECIIYKNCAPLYVEQTWYTLFLIKLTSYEIISVSRYFRHRKRQFEAYRSVTNGLLIKQSIPNLLYMYGAIYWYIRCSLIPSEFRSTQEKKWKISKSPKWFLLTFYRVFLRNGLFKLNDSNVNPIHFYGPIKRNADPMSSTSEFGWSALRNFSHILRFNSTTHRY